MKILFLTSRLPYPPHRGDKLKIYNLIKQLSQLGHQITLVSFISSKLELQYISELNKYCTKINTVYLPVWRSFFNCLTHFFSETPFQVAYYHSKRMKEIVKEELKNNVYDIVHAHLIRMSQYALEPSQHFSRLLDLTDAGSLYLQRFFDTTKNFIYKIFLKNELKRLTKYERILERFDKCLVCSDVDKIYLQNHAPKAKINLLYNGIDLEYFTNDSQQASKPFNLIFTGNMSYYPNKDGIIYFVMEIFPLIKKKFPKTKLNIVGKDPPAKVRKLSSDDITVTGFVPEIRDYYLQSTIAIAPIRFGAGTLNKILEPMAIGIPVVTTSIGVEGLPLLDNRDVLVADTPIDFANAVMRAMADEALYTNLSANAKMLVRSLYDWKNIAQQLEKYYNELNRN